MAKLTFEKAMKQLEEIVKELETGDLSLEKAIQRFEEGIQLSRFCSKTLDETEKRVQILLKDTEGKIAEKPFETEE